MIGGLKMICTECGFEGGAIYFSKTNLSKDKTKAMCKKCKQQRDSAYRKNREKVRAELPTIELLPDLLNKKGECLSCPKCGFKWQR
jgi:protein-arginine kinase activator protein McsA